MSLNAQWAITYGGSSRDYADSVQQTSDGGYIVRGSTQSFGAGGNDIWILKLSPDGEVEWQKTYGGNYSGDVAHSIQQTSDGGYIVTGQTSSWGDGAQEWVYEIWVLKLLPNGDINPRCAFIKNSNGQVSDTDIMPVDSDIIPEDSDIIPEDTNITPHDTGISPRDTDANVYKLCVSDICTLTLSASFGGTTNPAPGIHTYDTGTRVTLKAIPSDDYKFFSWRRNIKSDSNPITIRMDGDKTIKANFGKTWIQTLIEEKHCFIATAAYSSPFHPYVEIIQEFRDKYLMPNKFGRALVNLYYKYSPFVAELIAKHKALKVMVRINLLPFVAFSYSMVYLGPTITAIILVLIFALPGFVILFFRRRVERVRAKDPKALGSRF